MAGNSRLYELVLLGATGYTGRLTAEHITTSLPTDIKWAIAGRSEKKLTKIVEELKILNPDRQQPGIEVLELNNEELDGLAKKTHLVITTVGPYTKHGTPVVEACAKNGTHYVDCTGEIPWVLDMINKYHDTAKATGAIMVAQSGFDSTPADIIVYVLADYLRRTLNVGLAGVVVGIESKSAPSGGSLLTALSQLEHYTPSQVADSYQPFALSPVQHKSVCSVPPISLIERFFGIRYHKYFGVLTGWFQSAMDAAIVERSWGLLDGGKFYGEKFCFSEWMVTKSSFAGALANFRMSLFTAIIALAPIRWIMRKLVFLPGDGPDIQAAKNDYAHLTAIGTADSLHGERAIATFKIKGSLYYFTGLAIAEAAMVILRGENSEAKKSGGGFMTPATLGNEYVERLKKGNIEVDVRML